MNLIFILGQLALEACCKKKEIIATILIHNTFAGTRLELQESKILPFLLLIFPLTSLL